MLKRVLPAFLITLWAIVGCKNESYDFDSLPEPVVSYFTISGSSDELHSINEGIVFNNESENAEYFSWDFGDGTTSTEKTPTKAYSSPGLYSVSLKAVGPGGTGVHAMEIPVVDPDAVVETESELYFIEYGTSLVRKLPLTPGSMVETVINMSGKEAHGMAYDSVNEKIYYCDFEVTNSGKIWRMNPDGSELEEVLSGLRSPYGVALNLAAGKMYIADGANVSRANLDGSDYEQEFIVISGGAMRAVGFNTRTEMIYFYEVNDEDLYIADQNGANVTAIVQGAYGYGILIDEINEKIYFDDRRQSGLIQANLDGSSAVKVADFSGNRGGSGVSIDYQAEKIYWSETNLGNIKRANLDGTGAETVLSNVSNPRGMFIK